MLEFGPTILPPGKMATSEHIDETAPNLNPKFIQDLWYESEDGVIPRTIIEKILVEYFSRTHDNKLISIYIKGRIVKIPAMKVLASKILGNIGVKELNHLHKRIQKAVGKEKDEIANEQISMVSNAVQAVLQEDFPEENKEIIRELLA